MSFLEAKLTLNNMHGFKTLANTAEVKVSVESKSLENLFRDSLEGMNHLLKKDFCTNTDGILISSEIEISSYDSASLLLNFLSEIMALSHAARVIFCSAEFLTLTDKYLLARIHGCKINRFEKRLSTVFYRKSGIIFDSEGSYKTDLFFNYR